MTKDHLNTLVSLTVTMLVAVVTIPAATQAIFQSTDDDGNLLFGNPTILKVAKSDRQVQAQKRHRYYKAMEIYRDELKAGKTDIPKPDINDPATVAYYLDGKEIPKKEEASSSSEATEHAAAESTQVKIQRLPRDQRALLLQLENQRNCPYSLRSYAAGFYELCLSLIKGKEPVPVRAGFLNDRVRIQTQRGVLTNSLENRLKMLKQAREGTKREMVKPSRLKSAAPTE